MEIDEWLPLYERIVDEFGFDAEADLRAAEMLDTMLVDDDGWTTLEDMVRGARVVIAGAALGSAPPEGDLLISADGTTTGLLEFGIRPDVIVTDLDGPIDDQVACSREGSIVVVHAHGDNTDVIAEHVPRLSGTVLGTTQTRPFGRLRNHGGFTDGDRAVMLADEMGASMIILAGFNFDSPGHYSYHKDPEVKVAKLRWARRIIGMASTEVILDK